MSKFLVAVCSPIGVNNITPTEYQSQTNGQAESFISTVIFRLHQYVSGHLTDWNTYLLLLMYSYNIQVHMSIKASSFSLALTRILPELATVVPKQVRLVSDDDIASPMSARLGLFRLAKDPHQRFEKTLRLAQWLYKKDYDRSVCFAPIFRILDYVVLDRPLLFHSAAKGSPSEE